MGVRLLAEKISDVDRIRAAVEERRATVAAAIEGQAGEPAQSQVPA